MTIQEGRSTVHVVRTPDSEVEVFSTADEAWHYARCKRGATVMERTVHSSLGEAQVVYERRVHIIDGVVRRDTVTEEPFFTVDADSWIPACDVESYEAKDNRWTVVGLGTERAQINELVERETARLVASRLRSLNQRDFA